MAFDAALPISTTADEAPRTDFMRGERLVVLMGASALGAVIGFAVTLTMGRVDAWVMALIAAPVLGLALHMTIATLSEAFASRAYGCATACILHVFALMAWPATALFSVASAPIFWIAPALAMSSLVLFASCWGGGTRAVYRTSVQAALVAAIAAQQGVAVMFGA